MRADNHQLIQPLYLSVLADDVPNHNRGYRVGLQDARQDPSRADGDRNHLPDGAPELRNPSARRARAASPLKLAPALLDQHAGARERVDFGLGEADLGSTSRPWAPKRGGVRAIAPGVRESLIGRPQPR